VPLKYHHGYCGREKVLHLSTLTWFCLVYVQKWGCLTVSIDNNRCYLLKSILLTLTIEIHIDYCIVTTSIHRSKTNDLFCSMYRANEWINKKKKKKKENDWRWAKEHINTNQWTLSSSSSSFSYSFFFSLSLSLSISMHVDLAISQIDT
jgi:hypothetical protein